jgi:restriction system protein
VPLPLVFVTASILLAISNPAIGIPALLIVSATLWYTRPGSRRAWMRQRGGLRNRGPVPVTSTNYLALSPTQFEHALADLCRRDGCTNVRVVGGAGDLGADVICTTPTGQRLVIQAKRFGPKTVVGSGDIQKVNGTYRDIHHASMAAVVTTNRFTKDALALAGRVGIRTYDGTALSRWASRTGPAPWQ